MYMRRFVDINTRPKATWAEGTVLNSQPPYDRLSDLEKNFERKKKYGTQLYWIKYNRSAEYAFDLVDAREDVEWLIAELRQLRSENSHLREMLAVLRDQLHNDLHQ